MKKYEITSETKSGLFISKLYRIKSCINFTTVSGREVKKGDLGGWVEKEENLSQDGTAWIFDDAEVFGNAVISGNAEIYDKAEVFDFARVFGNAKVYGNAIVFGNAKVYGDASVYGNAGVSGKAEIYGKAKIYGNAEIYGSAKIFENAEVCCDAVICGDAVISKNAYIFSMKHLMCVSPFPINGHPVNLTMFRTKEGELSIQFDREDTKTIDEFKAFIDTFCEISDRLALITIVELGKRCIDLTPQKN